MDTKILDNKMREKMSRYYVAYGTNLNTGIIQNYKQLFRGEEHIFYDTVKLAIGYKMIKEFRIKKKCSLGYRELE